MEPAARAAWAAGRPRGDHPIDTACVAPWVSIEFDPAGWVYACCTSQLYPLGRIGTHRLADLWNGARAEAFREALRNWDLTVACGPCRWHLEHGRLDPVAATYDHYPVSGEDPAQPHMMLFALSNRCNLGCIMCTPELSTTLRTEQGLPPLESPYDDTFFEDLAPMLSGVRLAKFLGGEPFLAPEHKRVWDLMGQLDHPPRMQVTTNGTVWTDHVDRLLDRFEMDISISIDAATPATYAAIRRGGDLARVHENVARFAERARQRGTEFHVSYCLLDRNWDELGAFLEWAEQFDTVTSVNLVTDEGLALHDLPTERLEDIRRAWDAEDDRRRPHLERNLGVWETQLAQLDAVLAERRAGVGPAIRQAQPVPTGFFAPPDDSPPAADATTVTEHRDRLGRWSTDGVVAEVRVDERGRVTAVDAPHPRLGIGAALLGGAVDDLTMHLEVALGRRAWVIECARVDEALVRTVILSPEVPRRGSTGSVVRTVTLATASGTTLLVAEDRMYDHPGSAVAVGAPRRRNGVPG